MATDGNISHSFMVIIFPLLDARLARNRGGDSFVIRPEPAAVNAALLLKRDRNPASVVSGDRYWKELLEKSRVNVSCL